MIPIFAFLACCLLLPPISPSSVPHLWIPNPTAQHDRHLGRKAPCCGDCPVRCGMFSSVLRLSPLGTSNNTHTPPCCDNRKRLQTPWGQHFPPGELLL